MLKGKTRILQCYLDKSDYDMVMEYTSESGQSISEIATMGLAILLNQKDILEDREYVKSKEFKQISIRVSDCIYKRLRQLKKEKGLTINSVIYRAIMLYMKSF